MKWLHPVALLFQAVLAVSAGAADLETQHAVDVTLPLKPVLDLIIQSRVRTQPGGLGFYQVRAVRSSPGTRPTGLRCWRNATVPSRS